MELNNEGVDITPPEKEQWGGTMSRLKDSKMAILLL